MKIILVAAMSAQRVIGKNNQLPWHLPADLAHFKKLTWERPIVMGRNTYESIGRPLPHRRNIMISSGGCAPHTSVEVYTSVEAMLMALRNEPEIMIIGGQRLFEKTLPLAHRLCLTIIDASIEGDTYFPSWSEKEWQLVSQEVYQPDAHNPYSYQFVVYERKH